MDLNSILSQLGGGSKDTVYLSVTIGVGVELIQIDTASHTVKNYAYRPLQYNESLREISNIGEFKDAVAELFSELKISLESNVILNLPMVLFGSKELTLMIGDDAVTEALTSEVEQSYIFKRYEPVVSWIDSNASKSGELRKLFYSAVQKNIVDDIKTALTELGINLVGIEMSLTSVLKALAFSGLAEEQMKDGVSWNLMLVNQNGYSICSMIGKNIVDYYEEPLAIKSFEGEEIYNAINASVQITLMSYPANYLYIVSETDLVSAEFLAGRLQADCTVLFLENNSFKKQDVIPVSLEILEENARKISLEAIGIAASSAVNLPVKFNFLGSTEGIENPDEPVRIELGQKEFYISPNGARNICAAAAVALLIPFVIGAVTVPMIAQKNQAMLDDVNERLENTQQEIKKIQAEQKGANGFDINSEIKKVLKDNRSKLIAYSTLGDSVPKKLWLTYFVARDDGKFVIKGDCSNVEDIYLFFRNLKDSLVDTQLRLHKLELKSASIDEAVTLSQSDDYTFEITNMSDDELNPQPKTDEPQKKEQKPQQDNAQQDNDENLLNKPLMNLQKND